MDELTPEMTGRWLVTTQGSFHVWDLDAFTYTRLPGPSSASGVFEYDGDPQRITRVGRWPRVGGTFLVFYDDPEFPELMTQSRQSSRVASIEPLP